MEKISFKEIYYKETVIPYDRSENIFKEVPEAYDKYQKSLRSLKTGKSLGYITLGVFGVSILAIALDNTNGRYCDTICLTTGDAVGIIGIGLVVPLFGTISVANHFTGISRQKRAIENFNRGKDISSRSISPSSLRFGMTSNGIGFVFTF